MLIFHASLLGTVSQGGYASHMRAHEYFTFKIPDNIESEIAAPMVGPRRSLLRTMTY